jgi:hypothetical protein
MYLELLYFKNNICEYRSAGPRGEQRISKTVAGLNNKYEE